MHNGLTILSTEIALCSISSTLVIYLLQPVLKPLLHEICQGKIRALFWTTFTRLMLFIAPLLVVLLYSHSQSDQQLLLARILRDTLLHILFGQFSGLLVVGGVLLYFSNKVSNESVQELPYIPIDGEE